MQKLRGRGGQGHSTFLPGFLSTACLGSFLSTVLASFSVCPILLLTHPEVPRAQYKTTSKASSTRDLSFSLLEKKSNKT